MALIKEHRGYSLLELIMVMGLGATLTAAACHSTAGLDEARAKGAAHHVSGQLQRARMEAVRSGWWACSSRQRPMAATATPCI
jgi:prepilin-type N-terminal cleavage/methylation domain-containing protein